MKELKEVKKKIYPLRCSRCNSGQIYIRIKNKEKVCKSCGYIENNNLEEVEHGY